MLTPDDSRDIAKAICGAYALLYVRVQAFLEASQWCFDRLVEMGYVQGHEPKNPR